MLLLLLLSCSKLVRQTSWKMRSCSPTLKWRMALMMC